MKYFSLFSGIGGFELGIQQAYVDSINRNKNSKSKSDQKNNVKKRNGLVTAPGKANEAQRRWNGQLSDWSDDPRRPHCAGYSEIDKYAIQIYQKHFPQHKNYGDITKINAKELPDFELIVGGFPCQSFSIAGKRGGFSDTRGTLFFDIARILQAKQPRLFILENVKGLLSHDNGSTFKTIITTLTELGYDLQWQVLNSKNFGVPQNRERVFIIGHIRNSARSEIFPITESNSRNLEQVVGGGQGNRVYSTKGISTTIASQAGGRGAKTGLYTPTIRATSYKRGDNDTLIAHTVRGGGRSSGLDKKQNWDSYFIKGKIRRLTPLECERLQGFPDGWTEGVSDTQRYKMAGNAVTVNVIKELVKKLINKKGEF